MRIEDIEIKPNNKKKFDEKNWDINEWRKEYPVDYFNLSAMLVKPNEAILRDEVFKALYKIIRLYIPDTVYSINAAEDAARIVSAIQIIMAVNQ